MTSPHPTVFLYPALPVSAAILTERLCGRDIEMLVVRCVGYHRWQLHSGAQIQE